MNTKATRKCRLFWVISHYKKRKASGMKCRACGKGSDGVFIGGSGVFPSPEHGGVQRQAEHIGLLRADRKGGKGALALLEREPVMEIARRAQQGTKESWRSLACPWTVWVMGCTRWRRKIKRLQHRLREIRK